MNPDPVNPDPVNPDPVTPEPVETQQVYTVTFDANGGEGGWSKSMDYGATITAPTVTRTNYTFTGWQPAISETVPASNVTFTAQWKANGPVVTFNANKGTVTESERVVLKGKAIGTLPKPTRKGYKFKGWYIFVRASRPLRRTVRKTSKSARNSSGSLPNTDS